MWLATGPFDSASGDVTTTKTKLLKTGRKIPLGRKEKPLLVNNKKISRDHCEFTVGPCTQDDASNPSFVPTLEIYNAKDKAMSIDRDGQAVIVNPLSSRELKSGDKINIVVGISVEVHWRRIACFLPPARSLPSISSEYCAALGISLMSSPSSLATHHVTPKYELTVPLATSLLSATQLVRIEWLQELIRLGTTSDETHPLKLAPLEQSFVPPLESKYRPVFSPSLASSLKYFKFWEPNEERLHLLKGYRFVLLSETEGQVDGDTRELIVRGDGEYECFPLTNGEAKWRQLLAKAKRKVDEAGLKVTLVAREYVVQAAVGADRWREMITEAQSLSLPLINAGTLVNAVINTDASLINEGSPTQGGALGESESPLPDFVPNTHPNEPSLPVAPENAPAEPNDIRGKSPSPSPPPTLFGLPIPPPPSKNLIRRTKPLSTTSRTEEFAVKDDTQAENLGYALPPPPVTARSTKLKRRTPAPTPPVDEPVAENEQSEEPPLKKFKALFDASDPDKMTVDSQSLRDAHGTTMGNSVGLTQAGESLTQSDSRPPHSQVAAPPRTLDVVAEEEEEGSGRSQARATTPALPRPNRKSPLLPAAQESHVDATQDPGTSGGARSKQTKSKLAQSHQMDTDPAFLTALASRKGRKTAEDEFDREFNKLRISKPDIQREGEQAWEILGDFDTDARNLRGNFMVVMDLEVFRRDSSHRNSAAVTRTYDGRPNFKKFKKTPTPSSRAPIELIARAEHDYGVGSGYWKDSTISNKYETLAPTQTAGIQRRCAPTVFESDDGDIDPPTAKTAKRATRRAPRSKANAEAEKLFLDSDEEDPVPIVGPKRTVAKPRTEKIDSAPNLPSRVNKRRHIVVDDDSDNGVAFKGFGKRRRAG